MCYFIEVKGHLPQTEQISVSRRQVGKAHNNRERWRLAVVSVPEDPDAEPEVRYLVEPFKNVSLHPAQTSVPLNVAESTCLRRIAQLIASSRDRILAAGTDRTVVRQVALAPVGASHQVAALRPTGRFLQRSRGLMET